VTLFHKRGSEAESDEKPVATPVVADKNTEHQTMLEEAAALVPKVVTVSLSAELKGLLDQPLDPRVGRILQTINDGKVAEAPRSVRPPRTDEPKPDVAGPDSVDSLGEL
jgi:hypothetical protein